MQIIIDRMIRMVKPNAPPVGYVNNTFRDFRVCLSLSHVTITFLSTCNLASYLVFYLFIINSNEGIP